MASLLSAPAETVSDASALRLLVVAEPNTSFPALSELTRSGRVKVEFVATCAQATDHGLMTAAEAVLVVPGSTGGGSAGLEANLRQLAEALASHRLGALVVVDEPWERRALRCDLIMTGPRSTSPEELWGRLRTIADYRPLLAEMEHQLDNMQRLGKRLNLHFVELDQEMRLASRLQRDFLPRELPKVGPARFATLFRPASWVSGDIYDVCRVDETHVAFYVGDAVGHGVAAGLLTMFIKQAIQSKRIDGGAYQILSPDATMAQLNDALVEQRLPNCQFVTACYGMLDTLTLELSFARAGHPYPLHVTVEGAIHEVKVEGGLLGLFEKEQFPLATVQLHPGDKLLLYSDGLEDMLIPSRDPTTGMPAFGGTLLDAAPLPAQGFVDQIAAGLDAEEGSLNPQDDITLVVLEIAR
jgi:serine phosphatase RsbU (regulator of sigma subunit)